MTTDTATTHIAGGSQGSRLPVPALISLALIGFILVAMETMPAGLLPDIAMGMGTSEGTVGLFVSAYALGTVIVTVPAISLTRGFRRKPLLLTAVTGLVLANAVTAFSADVTLSLISRFIAGAFSGVIWGMLAAYSIRISPPDRSGVALSIMSIGAPLGFAFGTPLGAFIGAATDWRWAFAGLSILGIAVGAAILAVVPDAAPVPAATRLPLHKVLRLRTSSGVDPEARVALARVVTSIIHVTMTATLHLRDAPGEVKAVVRAQLAAILPTPPRAGSHAGR